MDVPRPAVRGPRRPPVSVAVELAPVTTRFDTIDASDVLAGALDEHRRALTGYCYRMLGSAFEADDAVQETMVRAWRAIDTFEGRSTMRSWLYRIATNVCLDMLRGRQRRARPMDLGPASTTEAFRGATLPESAWVQPIPDGRVLPEDGDPAEVAAARESVRLAFVDRAAAPPGPPAGRADPARGAALAGDRGGRAARHHGGVGQQRPPAGPGDAGRARPERRCDRSHRPGAGGAPGPLRRRLRALRHHLARRAPARRRRDVDAAVRLLAPRARTRWASGSSARAAPARAPAWCPTTANGCPAFGSYRPDGRGGHTPFAVQVIEISGGRIVGHHNFLDPALFPLFGLPERP